MPFLFEKYLILRTRSKLDMIRDRIIYWIATGLLSLMMSFSAGMYILNYSEVAQVFESLGYPSYLVYPLAVAKILGILAILTNKSHLLKEWAYAGFFFDFILVLLAHLQANDGEFGPSVVALLLLAVSYFFDKKVFEART